MKPFSYIFIAMTLMFLCQGTVKGQYFWAIATIHPAEGTPVIEEYGCNLSPNDINGRAYYRVHNINYRSNSGQNMVLLPFGLNISEDKIYIYDYDNQTEHVALDFSLKAGEEFTTINGERWIIEDVADSMMSTKDHFDGTVSQQSFKVQKVRNLETGLTDRWVKGVGSLTNHFMIKHRERDEACCLLWQRIPMFNTYFARDFSADPFFGHESVMMRGQELSYEEKREFRPTITCSYNNGEAFIQRTLLIHASYGYHLWYRMGDVVQEVWNWKFGPNSDCPEIIVTDTFTCSGLPRPTSGSYTFRDAWGVESTTGVFSPTATQPQWPMYDLQGRPISKSQPRQMYIEGGKKVVNGR